jgi:ABC-type branched-subunit amino acid transport system substrate-binding protein
MRNIRMLRHNNRRRCCVGTASAVIAVSVALSLAACSSSSPASGASSSSAPGIAAGAPITLDLILDRANTYYPTASQAAEAAADTINAAGGIKGHKVKIETCDPQGDPNLSLKCALDAVDNPSVLAVIGRQTEYGNAVVPELDKAGLADIGVFPNTSIDLQEKVGFPITAGASISIAADAALCKNLLQKSNVGVTLVDVPAAHAAEPITQQVAAQQHIRLTSISYVALTETDVSAAVATAARNADCLMAPLAPAQDVAFIKEARQQGLQQPIVLTDSTPAATIQPLGAATHGVYNVLKFDLNSPGGQSFAADMAKYAPTVQPTLYAVNAWLSVELFAQAAKSLSSFSRQSVLSAFNHMSAANTQGLTPTLNFTKESTIDNGVWPRLFNPTVVYSQYENGSYTPVLLNGSPFVQVLQ